MALRYNEKTGNFINDLHQPKDSRCVNFINIANYFCKGFDVNHQALSGKFNEWGFEYSHGEFTSSNTDLGLAIVNIKSNNDEVKEVLVKLRKCSVINTNGYISFKKELESHALKYKNEISSHFYEFNQCDITIYEKDASIDIVFIMKLVNNLTNYQSTSNISLAEKLFKQFLLHNDIIVGKTTFAEIKDKYAKSEIERGPKGVRLNLNGVSFWMMNNTVIVDSVYFDFQKQPEKIKSALLAAYKTMPEWANYFTETSGQICYGEKSSSIVETKYRMSLVLSTLNLRVYFEFKKTSNSLYKCSKLLIVTDTTKQRKYLQWFEK